MNAPSPTVRLVLTPQGRQSSAPELLDWLRKNPEYRTKVHAGDGGGSGGRSGLGSDAAIIAVLAHGALLGFFRLLKAWVDLQRSEASVRVRVRGSQVDIKVTARADPDQLVEQLTRATRQAIGRDTGSGQDK